MSKSLPHTISMTKELRAKAQALMEQEGISRFSAYIVWLIDEHSKREPTPHVVRMTEEQFRKFIADNP